MASYMCVCCPTWCLCLSVSVTFRMVGKSPVCDKTITAYTGNAHKRYTSNMHINTPNTRPCDQCVNVVVCLCMLLLGDTLLEVAQANGLDQVEGRDAVMLLLLFNTTSTITTTNSTPHDNNATNNC